jgi:uncharacterized protein (DUF111 family)
LQASLTDIPHDHHDAILSTVHVHLDHHSYLEVLIVRGKASVIHKIADELIAERRKLRREFAEVKTPFGKVTVKIGRLGGKVVQAAREFESAKKLAAKAGVPLKQIFEAAVKGAKQLKR